MKPHNAGELRTDLDSTLRIRTGSGKQKLGWKEYTPPIILCILAACLLTSNLLG